MMLSELIHNTADAGAKTHLALKLTAQRACLPLGEGVAGLKIMGFTKITNNLVAARAKMALHLRNLDLQNFGIMRIASVCGKKSADNAHGSTLSQKLLCNIRKLSVFCLSSKDISHAY